MTAAAKPDPPGLCCPRCHCRDLRVTKTLRLPGGSVRRYRLCRYCQHTLVTVERVRLAK